ncbi:MAG: RNA polymerase sigma factor, partial [Bradymonadaceae bacterium]
MTRDEFSDIVLRQLDDVTAFAHYLTDAEWEAEELVQATYESAFERWETLDDPEQCRAWLFQIARNQWNDWLRSRRAGPELELVDPQDPERPRPTVDPKTVSQIDEK